MTVNVRNFFFAKKRRKNKTMEKERWKNKLFVFVLKIVFCYSFVNTHFHIIHAKIAFKMKCGGWRSSTLQYSSPFIRQNVRICKKSEKK